MTYHFQGLVLRPAPELGLGSKLRLRRFLRHFGDGRFHFLRRNPCVDVTHVSQQNQHEEKRAQHIFAFGHPRDRFHAQWMQCKKRRDDRAWPEIRLQRARLRQHPQQQEKQQHRVRHVQRDIRQMMAAGIGPKELLVGRVRDHRQRIPVARDDMRESPLNARPRQTAGDAGVGRMFAIGNDDKTVLTHRQINHGNRDEQEHRDKCTLNFCVHWDGGFYHGKTVRRKLFDGLRDVIWIDAGGVRQRPNL